MTLRRTGNQGTLLEGRHAGLIGPADSRTKNGALICRVISPLPFAGASPRGHYGAR
jgi:hypothetical protein